MSWYQYAIKNNKILWITSNQSNLSELFNKVKIEQDIQKLNTRYSDIDTKQLKNLIDNKLLDAEKLKQNFKLMHVAGIPGCQLRLGLADKLRSLEISLDTTFANPGKNPGILVVNDDEYQQINAKLLPGITYFVEDGDNIGRLQDTHKILVMNDTQTPEQLSILTRNAWEKGRLVVLKSTQTKDQVIALILQGATTGNLINNGKEVGNLSRLKSMTVIFEEFVTAIIQPAQVNIPSLDIQKSDPPPIPANITEQQLLLTREIQALKKIQPVGPSVAAELGAIINAPITIDTVQRMASNVEKHLIHALQEIKSIQFKNQDAQIAVGDLLTQLNKEIILFNEDLKLKTDLNQIKARVTQLTGKINLVISSTESLLQKNVDKKQLSGWEIFAMVVSSFVLVGIIWAILHAASKSDAETNLARFQTWKKTVATIPDQCAFFKPAGTESLRNNSDNCSTLSANK